MKKALLMMILVWLGPSAFGAENSGELYKGLLPPLPPNQEVHIQESLYHLAIKAALTAMMPMFMSMWCQEKWICR